MRIEARAPARIDLAGGTLDIWPLYLFHPGALTVNCAINRYASCRIETLPRSSKRITLISEDTARRESFSSLAALERAREYRLPLLAHLVHYFLSRSSSSLLSRSSSSLFLSRSSSSPLRPRGGFTLTTNSQVPAGAGLGGSSAMAVAVCAALDRLTGAHLSRQDWIHISRDVEAMVIKVPTGTQDHYPAAFGGVSAIHLRPGGERREELECDAAALERHFVLCYTGKPRQSGINNWQLFSRHVAGDRRIWQSLEKISGVAREVRGALLGDDWRRAARLVREEWNFRRRSLPGISTSMIDRIIAEALRRGAWGGKVCGAGGGGCLVLLIDPQARAAVEAAVEACGATLLPHRIDRRGVRVTLL